MHVTLEYDTHGEYASALSTAGCPAAIGHYLRAWDDNVANAVDDHMIPTVAQRSTKSKGIGGITSGRHSQADNRTELERRIGEAHRVFAGVPDTKGFNLVAVGEPECDLDGASTPGARLHRQRVRVEGELQTRLTAARPRMPAPDPDCMDETADSCTCDCAPEIRDPENDDWTDDWRPGPTHRDSWEAVVEVETNNADRIVAASVPY